MVRVIQNVFAIALAGIVIGCESAPPAASVAPAGAPLPAGLIVTAAPDGAKGVLELKQGGAKAGDEVVLRGRVGGDAKPFDAELASFKLIDLTAETCEKMPGDACKTPWDACCDPKLAAKTATVQIAGADGQPLKAKVDGVSGIAPMKQLVIAGKVKGPVDEKQLMIEATKIYVVP